jgi:hypothetical protein
MVLMFFENPLCVVENHAGALGGILAIRLERLLEVRGFCKLKLEASSKARFHFELAHSKS